EKNVEIVPESWVNSTETLSRFPPKVTLALRNQIQYLIPPTPGWKEFPAIVKHKCATYFGANKCANELMEKDDLESDWTETESVVSSRKIPKRFTGFEFGYLNSVTDEGDLEQEHGARTIIRSQSPNTFTASISEESPVANSTRSDNKQNLIGHVQRSSTGETQISILPDKFQLFSSDAALPDAMTAQLDKISSENRKFYKLVLTKLGCIEADIAAIKKLQLSCQDTEELTNIPMLPLISKTELLNFESWMQDSENYSRLKTYLGAIGGKSGEAAIREILRKVLGPELTRAINWSGKNEKIEFEKLRLRSIITANKNV
ncbi:unnamed protein product, partial [Allacma fusca]